MSEELYFGMGNRFQPSSIEGELHIIKERET